MCGVYCLTVCVFIGYSHRKSNSPILFLYHHFSFYHHSTLYPSFPRLSPPLPSLPLTPCPPPFPLPPSQFPSPLSLPLPLPPTVARENAINSAVAASALNAAGSSQRNRVSSKMRQIHHPLFANMSYKDAEDRYTAIRLDTAANLISLYYHIVLSASICAYVTIMGRYTYIHIHTHTHTHALTFTASPPHFSRSYSPSSLFPPPTPPSNLHTHLHTPPPPPPTQAAS